MQTNGSRNKEIYIGTYHPTLLSYVLVTYSPFLYNQINCSKKSLFEIDLFNWLALGWSLEQQEK